MPAGNFAERIQSRTRAVRARAAARDELRRFLVRLAWLIGLLSLLIVFGALSFALWESISYWDGFLWTLDTVATVGSITHPETLGGQITQVLLITLGLGTMLYVLVTVTELFVAGDLLGIVEMRRMEQKISQLRDHYLVCGFGRVGRQVAADLAEQGVNFVVIDANPDVREAVEDAGVLYVEGNAHDDHVLEEAGIERARGVITCTDSDAENIFVTLTARGLRRDVQIVARAADDSSEQKLIRAGADEVVSPYKTSGRTMADLALRNGAAATAEPQA